MTVNDIRMIIYTERLSLSLFNALLQLPSYSKKNLYAQV